MHDYDFHPDEDTVRCFGVPEQGILVNDQHRCVYQVRIDDLVLRHFAFADEWFKLNVTYSLTGELIETGPPHTQFAINCDIATPMVRRGNDIVSTDLFLDVLVRLDGSYTVIDEDEFEQAIADGLVSATEARSARNGLTTLLDWLSSGRVSSLLAEFNPALACHAPPPLPFRRVAVGEVPGWHQEEEADGDT